MRAKYDKNAFNSISPDLLCHRADPSTLVRGRPHTASLIDDLTSMLFILMLWKLNGANSSTIASIIQALLPETI